MSRKGTFRLLKDAYRRWSEARASQLGAALAYYAVFSLAPLLLIALFIAGYVLGQGAHEQVREELRRTVGEEVAGAAFRLLQHAQDPGSGIVATVVAVVTVLVGATGVFAQLQDALDLIWGVEPKPGRGWGDVIKDRFLSFLMVLGTSALLLGSLVLTTFLTAVEEYVPADVVPGSMYLWEAVHVVASLAVLTLLFALVFKVMPDARVAWGDVWVGALLTALLFTLGKYLLGLYLGRSSTTSAYGAAGSLVVILLWVYYSSQIVLFGAAFTRVYAEADGKHVEPADNAVAVPS